jgi:hypothetical protein
MSLQFDTSNFDKASKFLKELDDKANKFVFQTYADKDDPKIIPKILHGSLYELMNQLRIINLGGSSVCVMVNESNGKRTKKDVTRVRALALDFDGIETPDFDLQPSIKVKTCRGEHVYWLMNNCDFEQYELLQSAMIEKYGADKVAKGIQHVLRVPGFYHQKIKDKPFLIDLVYTNGRTRYDIDYLISKFELSISKPKPKIIIDIDSVKSSDESYLDKFARCSAYIERVDGAIEGCGGDTKTYEVANIGYDFGLSNDEFWPLFVDWNSRCQPPWGEKELRKKLMNAFKYRKGSFGDKLDSTISIMETTKDFSWIEAFVENTKNSKKKKTLNELLSVDGIIGDIVNWVDSSSPKKQKILSLAGALSSMACILGRKVKTTSGLRTNLYIMSVGETGCGKDSVRKCIKRLYSKIGSIGHICDSFTSEAAIEDNLVDNPSMLALVDEAGDFLKSVDDKNAQSWVKSIKPMMLKMTGAAQSIYIPRLKTVGKDSKRQIPIENPCFSFYGSTNPHDFLPTITRNNIANGLLGRFIVFESNDNNPVPIRGFKENKDIPECILDWFNFWQHRFDSVGNLAFKNHDSIVVNETQEATDYFYEFEMVLHDKIDKLQDIDGIFEPYTRLAETAKKLSLVYACGKCKENPIINIDCAKWSCELSMVLLDSIMSRIDNVEVETPYTKKINSVIRAFKKDFGWHTKSWAMKKFRMNAKETGDILSDLIATGEIEHKSEKNENGNIVVNFRIKNS